MFDPGLSKITSNILFYLVSMYMYRVLFTEHIKIVDHVANHSLLIGQNVMFECKFDGDPKPTVTWYHVEKNGAKTQITNGIISIPEGSQLQLPSVGISDKGEYVCEANNGIETMSQHAYLVTEGQSLLINVSVLLSLYPNFQSFSLCFSFCVSASLFPDMSLLVYPYRGVSALVYVNSTIFLLSFTNECIFFKNHRFL